MLPRLAWTSPRTLWKQRLHHPSTSVWSGDTAGSYHLRVGRFFLSLALCAWCLGACGDGRDRPGILKPGLGASGSSTSTGAGNGAGGASGAATASGVGGGALCGERRLQPAACQSCMEAACCQAMLSCDLGSTCAELRSCLEGCSSATCKDNCIEQYGVGGEALSELDDCIDSQCNYECLGWPVCMSGYKTTSKACSACLAASCCEAFSACQSELACRNCLAGDSASCEATVLDEAAIQCRDNNCSDDCPLE